MMSSAECRAKNGALASRVRLSSGRAFQAMMTDTICVFAVNPSCDGCGDLRGRYLRGDESDRKNSRTARRYRHATMRVLDSSELASEGLSIRCHSWRSARYGSTFVARRASTEIADAAG